MRASALFLLSGGFMKKYFKIIHSQNVTMKVHATNYVDAIKKAMVLTGLAYDDLSYGGIGFE